MNGLCTPLSPSQQEHAQVERNVRNKCLPEKDSPQEKSLLRNMPLHRRLQRKNLHRPLTSCRSARNARVCRKRTAEYRWRKPSFSPENRKRSGGSPTAQGKNWLWKRKLTRCAGSPTTPERKNVLPVPLPGKLRPGREYGRPYLPAESFPPQESPQDKTEGKVP